MRGPAAPAKIAASSKAANVARVSQLCFSGRRAGACEAVSFAAAAALRRPRGRNLTGNAIGGSLPPEWGWESALIQLQTVSLEGNRLSGSLPETYGRPGAWAGLQALVLDNNQLTGAAGGCLWRCFGYLYLFLSSTVTLVVAGDCASTPQLEWGRDARCRSEPGAAMRRCWPPVVVGLRPYRP